MKLYKDVRHDADLNWKYWFDCYSDVDYTEENAPKKKPGDDETSKPDSSKEDDTKSDDDAYAPKPDDPNAPKPDNQNIPKPEQTEHKRDENKYWAPFWARFLHGMTGSWISGLATAALVGTMFW